MKTGVFLYEKSQVARLAELPATLGDRTIIAVGVEAELALEAAGITFESARDLRQSRVSENLVFIRALVIRILEDPRLAFFSYRGISIAKLFIPTLQYHLGTFFYYLDIFATAFEQHAFDEAITFGPSSAVVPTGGPIRREHVFVISDALALVCRARACPLTLLEVSAASSAQSLMAKRLVFGWVIGLLNRAVSLLPAKKVRTLASENWKNISAFMEELPESELLLVDRAEALHIGLRAILRHRMRFLHGEDFVTGAGNRQVQEATAAFASAWDALPERKSLYGDCTFRGYDLCEYLDSVLSLFVHEGGPRVARNIEGTFALCKRTKPQVVIVRAGISAQTHFAVLCAVARTLGIPSLEVQHGSLYFGPESFSWPRAAEYVGEYGPVVRKDFNDIGYDDAHLFDIGSPRFDHYARLSPRPGGETFRIACICPQIVPGFWTDSYEVLDFLSEAARAAASIPGTVTSIKLRPVSSYGSTYRDIVARAFNSVPYEISQYESLEEVFAASDAVVASYSTALTESIIAGRPTVFLTAGIPMYETFTNTRENETAIDAGALLLASDAQALSEALAPFASEAGVRTKYAAAARAFIDREYAFDGSSAKRLAEAVRVLAKKRAVL